METEEKIMIKTDEYMKQEKAGTEEKGQERGQEREGLEEVNKPEDEELGSELPKYLVYYDLEEQVEDLSKSTGLGKHIIRRVLIQQRKLTQNKLALGYGYNLPGLVKIYPEQKGSSIQLKAVAAQAITRPQLIRYCEVYKTYDEMNEPEVIIDEEFE